MNRRSNTEEQRFAHSSARGKPRTGANASVRTSTAARQRERSGASAQRTVNSPAQNTKTPIDDSSQSAAFRFIILPLAVGVAFVAVGVTVSCVAGFAT